MQQTFATAINCIDGRAQIPVIEYLTTRLGVDYIDMVTEPGSNGVLAQAKDTGRIERLKKKVGISVERHHSKAIAIVGHHDCAGNPVDAQTQQQQLYAARDIIAAWGFPVEEILVLWLDEQFNINHLC